MAVFAWEALLTAALGLVVYGCAVANSAFKPAAPVGIGVAVTCAIMAGKPLASQCISAAAVALTRHWVMG
jgi:hypothetical protein